MTTPYLDDEPRGLAALRETILANIAWHERKLAERRARLAEIDAELAHQTRPPLDSPNAGERREPAAPVTGDAASRS